MKISKSHNQSIRTDEDFDEYLNSMDHEVIDAFNDDHKLLKKKKQINNNNHYRNPNQEEVVEYHTALKLDDIYYDFKIKDTPKNKDRVRSSSETAIS